MSCDQGSLSLVKIAGRDKLASDREKDEGRRSAAAGKKDLPSLSLSLTLLMHAAAVIRFDDGGSSERASE